MAHRVFFHIGLPKSGTTYLQTILWRNRGLLRERGFLYPGRRRMEHDHAFRQAQGAPLEALAGNGDVWGRFTRALAEWDGTALLSHEFWSMLTVPQAKAALADLAPADVQVVITARDYVRQFPAVWQESLKMISGDSFDEFMEKVFARETVGPWGWRTQDVVKVAHRWAKAVGDPQRVHIVTLPPAGAPRDVLWHRWRDVLGFDDTGFDMSSAFGNESLGAPQAALLHDVKAYLDESFGHRPEFHRWVRQYFGHEVLVPQNGPRFGMRPEQAARMRELSLEAVASLERAGYQVTGDLADLVPPEQPERRPSPDEVSEAERLEVAARAIERMIRDVRDLTRERDLLLAAQASGPTGSRPANARVREAVRGLRARAGGALRRQR